MRAYDTQLCEQVKLLPCPFCGSEDVDASFWMSKEGSGPGCMSCGSTAETVAIWNSRSDPKARKTK